MQAQQSGQMTVALGRWWDASSGLLAQSEKRKSTASSSGVPDPKRYEKPFIPTKLFHCPKNLVRHVPNRTWGLMLKRSKHLKRWNPRFFVVRGNFIVDYYEHDVSYQNGETPLGTLNLAGYEVVSNLNVMRAERRKRIAEEAKVGLDTVPQADDLSSENNEITVELYHPKKTPSVILLQAANVEERQMWELMFEKAHYFAPRFFGSESMRQATVYHTNNGLSAMRSERELMKILINVSDERPQLVNTTSSSEMAAVHVPSSQVFQNNSSVSRGRFYSVADSPSVAGRDRLHKYAFVAALQHTKWELSLRPDLESEIGDGEVEILSTVVHGRIQQLVMSVVMEKLTEAKLPSNLHYEQRCSFLLQANKIVQSSIANSWEKVYERCCKTKAETEGFVKEKLPPIYATHLQLASSILEKHEKRALELLASRVTPFLTPFLKSIAKDILEAFQCMVDCFDDIVEQHRDYPRRPSDCCCLVTHFAFNRGFLATEKALDELFDDMHAACLVFESQRSPWIILSDMSRILRKLLDNALYTYEYRGTIDDKVHDEAWVETKGLLVHDCRRGYMKALVRILVSVTETFWQKNVILPAKGIETTRPLLTHISDALKEYFCVESTVEDVLQKILVHHCYQLALPFVAEAQL